MLVFIFKYVFDCNTEQFRNIVQQNPLVLWISDAHLFKGRLQFWIIYIYNHSSDVKIVYNGYLQKPDWVRTPMGKPNPFFWINFSIPG